MDWTAGYASDIEYTAGFYVEQSPSYLNVVCALNGVEPPVVSGPFTYFELGFGRGLTANVLAASNPEGTFYAADFNPAHVSGAQALASAAQLSNLRLLENSFSELAEGKVELPQFDYITLHGIYTWVTGENRRHIVDFISRYLKPGGVVYTSYNAMPGWAAAQPLQRLLVEYGDAFPNRSNIQMEGAAAFVERLANCQAGYFSNNPSLKTRLETLRTGSRNYLVHEYMHKHWQPLYHADVARDFAQAKLDFAGSANLPFAYPTVYLNKDNQELVNTVPDSTMRETIKDYILNTVFRKDVFVRGARKMGAMRAAEVLAQVGLALTVPRSSVAFKLKTDLGELTANAELYGAVCDALVVRPRTLGELRMQPALANVGIAQLMQVAALLSASGQAAVFLKGEEEAAVENARKMNAALVAHLKYADEYQVLCSPILGQGIASDLFDRFAFGVLAQRHGPFDIDTVTALVWERMAAVGRRLTREGAPLTGAEDNIAELRPHVEKILRDKLPIWQHLKML